MVRASRLAECDEEDEKRLDLNILCLSALPGNFSCDTHEARLALDSAASKGHLDPSVGGRDSSGMGEESAAVRGDGEAARARRRGT